MSDFWSDPSYTSIFYVCEQQRLWRDCAHAQSRLSRRCLPFAYAISTIISWAGSFLFCKFYLPAFVFVNLFAEIRRPILEICLFAVYWPRIFRLGRLVGNKFFFCSLSKKKKNTILRLNCFFFKNAKHIYWIWGKLVVQLVNGKPKYF